MQFPVYRKYPNASSYFKIISEEEFTELQKLGNRWIVHQVKAKTYPDKLLISDMLQMKDGIWIEVGENEFNSIKSL